MGYFWIVKAHNVKFSKVWGVAEHGKGEVDAAGGRSCKCRLRRPVQLGNLDIDCMKTVFDWLRADDAKTHQSVPKFYNEISPEYHEAMKTYHDDVKKLRKDKEIDDFGGHYISEWQWARIEPSDVDAVVGKARVWFKTMFNPQSCWFEATVTFPPTVLDPTHYQKN